MNASSVYDSVTISPVTRKLDDVLTSNSIGNTSGVVNGIATPSSSSMVMRYSGESIRPIAWLLNGSTKNPFLNLSFPASSVISKSFALSSSELSVA